MRLIDADELIKELSIALNGKQIFSDDAKDTILRIIDEQPTAYDVDKVIDDFQEWLKTQIVGVDNTTNEILVVVDDMWVLAIDKFKESF